MRPDTVPVVEREAKRLGISKTGMLAEIVEAWATTRASAVLSRRLTVCRIDGCERAVTARGLCGAHYQQARAGKPLKPAWERMRDTVKMGSLRLSAEAVKRLRTAAADGGLTVSEVIRRALAEALQDPPGLAAAQSQERVRATARLGVLRLPAELAERLNVTAQELGLSVAEVVRRALD